MRRWSATGERGVAAHGGYLLRSGSFRELELVALARQVLALEGLPQQGIHLELSADLRRGVVRLAFGGPPELSGEAGARWHATHHLLASQLSLRNGAAVRAYALVPDAFEKVVTYGDGRAVGGETLQYADVELPEEALEDDEAFALLQRSWPLGHLAHVFDLTREALLALGAPAMRLPLDGSAPETRLDLLLPDPDDELLLA
ncbi:MAG TPA: hypothetical protein VK013_17005 [Myxococcaceae bacterium]|nr:hypothetical protein [Myxococcaceae bacterium]